ncbi:AMP-binding protein [Streptomyces sp. TS71-3]|uniref:AMP-binding protein n=1 Tax=Streptomyces sp. TS71-3 TaxID=2733862 RepID=UPI001B18B76C|nr:AMP-binding protein [Streptomyces sp. TS71-3]GHJ39878.1 AMP-dependent synthetase [Streptomyces sp. TS71-3]
MVLSSRYSHYTDVPAVELPIHEAVLGGAAARGDAPALIDGTDGTTVGYAQLDADHRRIAAGLAAAGVRKGDVLALHSPNTIDYPAAFYGAARAGAPVTLIHPLSTAEEFARQLADSGARWIVTVGALAPVARAAAERAGGIREVFVTDRAEGHRSLRDLGAADPGDADRDAPGTPPGPALPAVDPCEDIAALPYSSGTTGTPKGVMLTHRSIATNLAQLDPVMPLGPGQRILAVLPFFHIYGLTALMNHPLRRGATVVVLPRFDLEAFLGAIERHRVTGLYVAPPIVLALARHPAVDRYDLSSLRFVLSAAAPLDGALAQECAQRLGLPHLAQAYGMTELSPGTHVVPLDARDVPAGTVGRLLPSTEMRVLSLDDPAADVPAGVPGELAFRGPQVMKGYLGRPDATAAMIDEAGWLHTGDVGYADGQGWLYVVDRVKELIKYKGYQVAPAELEALLLGHPGIADAAVVGVVDDDGNEIPKAYVVPAAGSAGSAGSAESALTADSVMAWAAERVAPYKKIRRVEFIGEIPRAASGKILRRELRSLP